MSEPIQQPHDSEIEALAAGLAKRRKRLLIANLLILIVPLAACLLFVFFGRDDRTWVRDKVVETVKQSVPREVEEEVPSNVRKALEKTQVEQRLARLEALLNLPLSGGEPEPGAAAGPPAAAQVSPEPLAQLDALESRLGQVERDLGELVKPDGDRSVPALWTSLEGQRGRLDAQKTTLDEHLRQIQTLEELRTLLTEKKVPERLDTAEKRLDNLPADLNRQVEKIPDINRRIFLLEQEIQKIADFRQDLQKLETKLKTKIDEDLKKLDGKWDLVHKEEQEVRKMGLAEVDRQIKTVAKSVFRSTLTRETDEVTIPSLGFRVRTGELGDRDTLDRLIIEPPGASAITLPPPIHLDRPLSFRHQGCDYKVTVRRVTKIRFPGFRNYVEILLGQECPNQG